MFVDASALVAIITGEPERHRFEGAIRAASEKYTSAIALYEAAHAVARKTATSVKVAAAEVRLLTRVLRIDCVDIAAEDAEVAVMASAQFGKGSGHPARLNMGDCFAYAMAVNRGLPLLFKGDDFGRTDIVPAVADPFR